MDMVISASATAAVLLIPILIAGWVTLRKSKVETAAVVRNGEIGEWRELLDKSKEENGEIIVQLKTELREQKEKCSSRCDEQAAEIKELRTENIKIYSEMAGLRTQIAARETERIEQRVEIRGLEKTIAEVAKPDTEALAQALAPKLAEAMTPVEGTAPTPVKIVGQSEEAIRTKDQP